MIDVVFQLVLFLLLSMTFRRPDAEEQPKHDDTPAIKVDLPRASATALVDAGDDVNVWISAAGDLYLDDQTTDLASLRREFRKAAAKDRNTLVVIKADESSSHGKVVAVMDAARAEGLARLAIATEGDAP